MPCSYRFLESRESLDTFIDQWERGVLPKSEWTHAAHITVGTCYVLRYGATALDRIREGILRYNAAVGTANTDSSGYHETLTRFWYSILVVTIDGITDPLKAARLNVTKYGASSGLHKRFYSTDIVRDVIAKRVGGAGSSELARRQV